MRDRFDRPRHVDYAPRQGRLTHETTAVVTASVQRDVQSSAAVMSEVTEIITSGDLGNQLTDIVNRLDGIEAQLP